MRFYASLWAPPDGACVFLRVYGLPRTGYAFYRRGDAFLRLGMDSPSRNVHSPGGVMRFSVAACVPPHGSCIAVHGWRVPPAGYGLQRMGGALPLAGYGLPREVGAFPRAGDAFFAGSTGSPGGGMRFMWWGGGFV
ncbi:hypothetical protein C7460_1323 [Marinoscillum furvescens DSM 4134]|uniref:Uncharacterized protein n=1 Tax=Marinoscillum furvescens DSM 4134 TaxID=1122208 RepID=A0A3D9KYD6_MARFU|nr:hypothetical protein C7460_1323 [Marinoscillum furvescens DSM 4134]